ncbi:MAG TPA: isoleucine--tRNA ligase, partial [bacterium]|nr:isoleucine--tRNA ligase [bacterium]
MKYPVNLPRTDFSMKANLKEKEPFIQKFWKDNGVYEKMVRKGKKNFILHDGPPYANGKIHLGHVLNKILKDIILKYKSLDGFRTPYVPGWDCHGLPIEFQLLKDLGKRKSDISCVEFRKKAAQYALKFVGIQREEFKRLGIFGEWDKPYLTLDPKYEAKELEVFADLVEKGYIYRGKKPVYWCGSCETALAEAEVEYQDKESPSVYVRFSAEEKDYDALIWTTTPWTLPANLALAFHPHEKYHVIGTPKGKIVLAKERLEKVKEFLGLEPFTVLEQHDGSYFAGMKFRHPFLNKTSVGVVADFVSMEEGTGIVHIAPGHGEEDYALGNKLCMDIYCPVDDKGKFTEEAGICCGENGFQANPRIIEILREKGRLLHHDKITHSYPHCWRCKKPVIFRATFQWFFDVNRNNLRSGLIDSVKEVKWVPPQGENRIRGMLETRPDWCLSRQRYWGVPLPVFYCSVCKNPLIDPKVIRYIACIFREKGSDSWFELKTEQLLPPKTRCSHCDNDSFYKENDIFDVWFDSGISHTAVLKQRKELGYPADLYLEGSDQHRGWFQTSLIPAVAIAGHPPYKSILTHGFVVDGEGKKMSKSLGNVIEPARIIDQWGAEILRLWVASEDYREDMRISDEILKYLIDSYRKIRNTFKFLLGNLYDFREEDKIPYDKLKEVDKWAVQASRKWHKEVRESYDSYDFYKVYQLSVNFINRELSSFYLDILKDRLYTFAPDSAERRSAQTV